MTAEQLRELEEEMLSAAEELDFERAAELRDRIEGIKGETPTRPDRKPKDRRRRRSKQKWMP